MKNSGLFYCSRIFYKENDNGRIFYKKDGPIFYKENGDQPNIVINHSENTLKEGPSRETFDKSD